MIRDRSVFMKDVLVVGTSVGVVVVLLVQFCAPDVSDRAVEGILLVFLVMLFLSTVQGLVRGSLASQVCLVVPRVVVPFQQHSITSQHGVARSPFTPVHLPTRAPCDACHCVTFRT